MACGNHYYRSDCGGKVERLSGQNDKVFLSFGKLFRKKRQIKMAVGKPKAKNLLLFVFALFTFRFQRDL